MAVVLVFMMVVVSALVVGAMAVVLVFVVVVALVVVGGSGRVCSRRSGGVGGSRGRCGVMSWESLQCWESA